MDWSGKFGMTFGDRVLVRKLDKPEKVGRFYIPEMCRKQEKERQVIWWGEVEAFGYDSRCKEAFDLAVGDIVGIDPVAAHCDSFLDEDGNEHVRVPDEHIAVKGDGGIYGKN